MNTPKRQALADFDSYSLCQGQSEMAQIGYSPLPINLVEASFSQVDILHQADSQVDVGSVNVAQCNNPTFIPGQPNVNYLAQIAPYPAGVRQGGQRTLCRPVRPQRQPTGECASGPVHRPRLRLERWRWRFFREWIWAWRQWLLGRHIGFWRRCLRFRRLFFVGHWWDVCCQRRYLRWS